MKKKSYLGGRKRRPELRVVERTGGRGWLENQEALSALALSPSLSFRFLLGGIVLTLLQQGGGDRGDALEELREDPELPSSYSLPASFFIHRS